jgi:hypothetical protein
MRRSYHRRYPRCLGVYGNKSLTIWICRLVLPCLCPSAGLVTRGRSQKPRHPRPSQMTIMVSSAEEASDRRRRRRPPFRCPSQSRPCAEEAGFSLEPLARYTSGLVHEAQPAGAMGFRALAAAAFSVGIKSSSPSSSQPECFPDPVDFRVLSLLSLNSTSALSSNSWHAFCRMR